MDRHGLRLKGVRSYGGTVTEVLVGRGIAGLGEV